MSQWNTLSVPLETGWQCTLVLTSEYRNSSGELFVFIQGKELKQLEQDRQDFDRSAKSSMTISMTMHPDQTPKVRAHALAHATFIISGDAVVPDFWTEYFGIPPDSTITKGKPFLYPSGKLSTRPGKLGLWAVKSESAVCSDHLTPHLRYLTDRLLLPRAGLRNLVCQDEAKMSFWCYWHNETGDRVPDVPDDIRAMMEEMGGTIEIDEYR